MPLWLNLEQQFCRSIFCKYEKKLISVSKKTFLKPNENRFILAENKSEIFEKKKHTDKRFCLVGAYGFS